MQFKVRWRFVCRRFRLPPIHCRFRMHRRLITTGAVMCSFVTENRKRQVQAAASCGKMWAQGERTLRRPQCLMLKIDLLTIMA